MIILNFTDIQAKVGTMVDRYGSTLKDVILFEKDDPAQSIRMTCFSNEFQERMKGKAGQIISLLHIKINKKDGETNLSNINNTFFA